jgi:hypothetical protein
MTNEAAIALYDFETVLPSAAKAVFAAAGLAAYTLADTPTVQRSRPRVEIIYRHGGNSSPAQIHRMTDGTYRVAAFRGELSIYVITDADATGRSAHSAYRAQVRAVLASLPFVLNAGANPPLPKHAIHFPPVSESEEHGIRQADGFEQTTFTWNINFSIQANAWE